MLEFNDVSFVYPPDRVVLHDINFSLNKGEFSLLTGKSGVGKSTLLKLIYFALKPTEGYILFDKYNSLSVKSSEIYQLRRRIGVIFQSFELLKDRNVQENLAFIPEVTGVKSKEIKKRVNEALQLVGLTHRRLSKPAELSGGEQQRVAIARAIMNSPELIIADEPTGNLDPETSAEILELILQINKMGTAILFATHNYELFKSYKGRVLKLSQNGLTESKSLT